MALLQSADVHSMISRANLELQPLFSMSQISNPALINGVIVWKSTLATMPVSRITQLKHSSLKMWHVGLRNVDSDLMSAQEASSQLPSQQTSRQLAWKCMATTNRKRRLLLLLNTESERLSWIHYKKLIALPASHIPREWYRKYS